MQGLGPLFSRYSVTLLACWRQWHVGTPVPLPVSCSDRFAGGGLSIPSSMQGGTWVAWEEATACGMSLDRWQGWDKVTQSETRMGLVLFSSPALPRPTSEITWWNRSTSQLRCRSCAAGRQETPRNLASRVSPGECWWQKPIWVHAQGWSSTRASCGQGWKDRECSTVPPKGAGRGARHLVASRQQASPVQSLFSPAAVVSGTLVLLELRPAPEPSLDPEDGGKEPERDQPCSLGAAQPKGQHQAAQKEGSPGSPATAQEPSGGQSHLVEQPLLGQPSAGSQCSQVQNWWHGLGPSLRSLPRAGGPVGEGSLMAWGWGVHVAPPADLCAPPFPPCSLVSACTARCQGWPGGAGSSQQVSAPLWEGSAEAVVPPSWTVLPQGTPTAPLCCSTRIPAAWGTASALGM